jgi:hypothetical protein
LVLEISAGFFAAGFAVTVFDGAPGVAAPLKPG